MNKKQSLFRLLGSPYFFFVFLIISLGVSERRAKLGPNANETNDVRVPRVTGSQFRQETFFFLFVVMTPSNIQWIMAWELTMTLL